MIRIFPDRGVIKNEKWQQRERRKKNIQRRDESNHFLSLRSVIFSIDNRPRGTASFRVFGQSRFRFPPAPSVKNCRLVRLCLSRRVTPTDDASARWNLASYSRPHFPFLARCHFSSSHPINTWSSTSISAILSQSFHSSFFSFFFFSRNPRHAGSIDIHHPGKLNLSNPCPSWYLYIPVIYRTLCVQ